MNKCGENLYGGVNILKVLGRSVGETQCPGSPGFQAPCAVRFHIVVVVPKSKD